MMATIDLDDQPCAKTHEIGHVRPNRLLAPEFLAIQTMRAQVPPQLGLALGDALPQVPGELQLFHSPLPQPPRRAHDRLCTAGRLRQCEAGFAKPRLRPAREEEPLVAP